MPRGNKSDPQLRRPYYLNSGGNHSSTSCKLLDADTGEVLQLTRRDMAHAEGSARTGGLPPPPEDEGTAGTSCCGRQANQARQKYKWMHV